MLQMNESEAMQVMDMDHSSHNMAGMEMAMMSADIVTLNYAMLRAPEKTTLPDAATEGVKI